MIALYINGKKASFQINFGWYRGEDFALFNVVLLSHFENTWTIFSIKVVKFVVSLDVELDGDA